MTQCRVRSGLSPWIRLELEDIMRASPREIVEFLGFRKRTGKLDRDEAYMYLEIHSTQCGSEMIRTFSPRCSMSIAFWIFRPKLECFQSVDPMCPITR